MYSLVHFQQAGFDDKHLSRLLTIELQEGNEKEKKSKKGATDW